MLCLPILACIYLLCSWSLACCAWIQVELGATELTPLALGDDQHEDKWETEWLEWLPGLWNELPGKKPSEVLTPASYKLISADYRSAPSSAIVPPGAKLVSLVSATNITPDSSRSNWHYEFDLTGKGMPYSCGDCLAVYPTNETERVSKFLDQIGREPDELVQLIDLLGQRRFHPDGPLPEVVSLGQLCSEVLDIFGWPKMRFYEALGLAATDPKEKAELQYLITKEGKAKRRQEYESERMTYADLLRAFPSAGMTLEHLIDFIPPIKPRLYSIASASAMRGEHLHLCIVDDDSVTPSGKAFHGHCTSFLRDMGRDVGEGAHVAAKISPAAIQLPSDHTTPMLMVGLGTGYAPFRAFMEERKQAKMNGEKTGDMALFFGARHGKTDFLYGCSGFDEIGQFQRDGVLTQLRTAFSRDQADKIYVQHRMMEEPELVYDYLVRREGYFYLCGPSGPVKPVRAAVCNALQKCGGMSAEEADAYVTQMQLSGRYNLEVW